MAAGTGKTRVATALIDVLRRAKSIKRALFLVDRIPLRDQALETFEDLIPAEPQWPDRLGGRAFSRNRRLYVATYPNDAQPDPERHDAADDTLAFFTSTLIFVADESHRSIYDVYEQVVDYFQAIRLGLTATPTNLESITTHSVFFDCEVNRSDIRLLLRGSISRNTSRPTSATSTCSKCGRSSNSRESREELCPPRSNGGCSPKGL